MFTNILNAETKDNSNKNIKSKEIKNYNRKNLNVKNITDKSKFDYNYTLFSNKILLEENNMTKKDNSNSPYVLKPKNNIKENSYNCNFYNCNTLMKNENKKNPFPYE